MDCRDLLLYVSCNKKYLEKSTECGCIYCLNKLCPTSIVDFGTEHDTDTGILVNETIICPVCGIDYVIPDFVYNYTDEFLKEQHTYTWSRASMERRLSDKNKANPDDKLVASVDKDFNITFSEYIDW